METLAERAKRLRTERGLTQQQVAKRSGLSQVTISDIERGRNKASRELIPLADALDTTPTYLATGKEAAGRGAARGLVGTPVALRNLSRHPDAPDSLYIGLFDEGSMKPGTQVSVRSMEVSPQWVQENLPGVDDAGAIMLLICMDDSMEGTFGRGDVVVLNTSVRTISSDGIYAFVVKDEFFLKRLQRLPDGGLMVISDNKEKYPPHRMSESERGRMRVKGRALYTWNGRRL